jgi:hypothetical protein
MSGYQQKHICTTQHVSGSTPGEYPKTKFLRNIKNGVPFWDMYQEVPQVYADTGTPLILFLFS